MLHGKHPTGALLTRACFVLVLVYALSAGTALAQTVTFDAAAPIDCGDTMSATVAIDAAVLDVQGFEFTLTYDETILSVGTVSLGTGLPSQVYSDIDTGTPGEIYAVWAGNSSFDGDEVLLNLTFTDAGIEGTSDLEFTTASLKDSAALPITVTTVNGTGVNNCNHLPVAVADSYTLAEGGTLNEAAPGVLVNDDDPDGEAITAVLDTGPAHASSFMLHADGSFDYTHDGSETISDSFTYHADDGTDVSATVTVTLTITPVNDLPVANDDTYGLNEGDLLNGTTVLANDTDAETVPLTMASLISGPAHASSFAFYADGTFDYQHDDGESTVDSFVYEAADGDGGTDQATVTLNITGVNDVPVAFDDAYALDEGATLTVPADGVLTNDTDGDLADALTAVLQDDVLYGTLTLNADGSFTYTHDGSEDRPDSFTYWVNDGTTNSASTATVTLTINPLNDAPVAAADSYTLDEGATLTEAAPGVLGNDSDEDVPADVLTAVLDTDVVYGTLTLNADGSFTYVHDGSENHADSFTYHAEDGIDVSGTVTVDLTITPVNDPPVVDDIADVSVPEGTDPILSIDLDDYVADPDNADGDLVWSNPVPVNLDIDIDPVTHVLTVSALDMDWNGSETITFTACDLEPLCDMDDITFTVTPVNDAPVVDGIPDASIPEGTSCFPVFDLDDYVTDVDNTDAEISWTWTASAEVTVSVNVDNEVTVCAVDLNWNGSVAITFTGTDPGGLFDDDVAIFTVTPINDPPVVTDIPDLTIPEGTACFPTFDLDDYVSDIEDPDAAITWTWSTSADLTITIDGDHVVTACVVDANWAGSATITFTATDTEGGTDSDDVIFTVTPVNDPPVVDDIPDLTITEGTSCFPSFDLDDYVSDVEDPDASITWTWTISADVTVNVDGDHVALACAADLEWCGSVTITFTAEDTEGGTDSDDVTFTVDCVNDPPILVTPGSQVSIEKDVVSLPLSFSDADLPGDTHTWSAVGLPPGLSIDSGTGLISGQIDCGAGNGTVHVVQIDIVDAGVPAPPLTDSIVFTWTVNSLDLATAITDLTATQVKSGNDSDGTTGILISWTTAIAGTDRVELYRKGYGDYPEFDDGTGLLVTSAPSSPGDALTNGWQLVSLDYANGEVDEVIGRDYWYYAAFVRNACEEPSLASNLTPGTLNYHLGDVDQGDPLGMGDNLVNFDDVLQLSLVYGTTEIDNPGLYKAWMDIGPTFPAGVDGLPTTDNEIGFEDLILLAVNYDDVSKALPAPAAAARDLITLYVPEAPNADGIYEVQVWLASTGELQALSTSLSWNSSVVEPVGMVEGDFMATQSGRTLVISPEPGAVDAALFGTGHGGISGEGHLATLSFRAVGEGDPEFELAELLARNGANEPMVLESEISHEVPGQEVAPAVSLIYGSFPNPFNPKTTVSYGLSAAGHVSLRVYAVDGRLMRTLVDEHQTAGSHDVLWDGRDDAGNQLASGAYLARMHTTDRTQTIRLLLLK